LIVSADDFGLTEGINRGIIQSFKEGIVTSASLMASTPAFKHAVELARSNPDLAIGIHLNLVKGKPLQPADKVRSLVNNKGVFYTIPWFVPRLLLGRINFTEVESELRNQIEMVRSTGLKVTHLDSHRHFHLFPSILRLVIRLAKEYGIAKIRCPLATAPGSLKELALTLLSRRALITLESNDIKHNDKFFELLKIETSRDYRHAFYDFCRNLPQGVTELDCHPGFITGELDGIEASIHNRERQVEILTHPDIKKLLGQYDIRLVNYGDIG